MPLRPCRAPRCSALVAPPATRCAAHALAEHRPARRHDARRGTAAQRGYDSRWRTASRAFLSAQPLCPGTLIPTLDWTPDLARDFHAQREAALERGQLLHLAPPASGVASARLSLHRWLELHPIYRVEPWGTGQPATVVDHIVPHRGDPDLFWAEWNWQPLTKRAHDRKTAREDRPAPPPPT